MYKIRNAKVIATFQEKFHRPFHQYSTNHWEQRFVFLSKSSKYFLFALLSRDSCFWDQCQSETEKEFARILSFKKKTKSSIHCIINVQCYLNKALFLTDSILVSNLCNVAFFNNAIALFKQDYLRNNTAQL